MKLRIFLVLLLLLSPSIACAEVTVIPRQNISEENTSQHTDLVTFAGANSSILPLPSTNVSDLENKTEDKKENKTKDSFDDYDAGSDMVAVGMWEKGPTVAANSMYETFGTTRGFITTYITYNIDPELIPVAKDYNNMNQTTAVILAVLFIIGEGLLTSVAASNYPAYRNAFGEKDFSQQKFAGGGLTMIAGLGSAWIFRGVMALINLVDLYMMVLVMDAIKPSLDTGVMYFAMAVIEILLLAFFFYRQMIIVAMYIVSPIYGVFWASGYAKEFIDSIGDKVLRALIMQPLCIFITTVSILVMQVMELDIMGIQVWDADDNLSFYLVLLVILLYTCYWCLFSDMKLVKRTGSLLLKKAVYAL